MTRNRVPLLVHIDADKKEKLAEYAKKWGMNLSWVIRNMIEAYIEEYSVGKKETFTRGVAPCERGDRSVRGSTGKPERPCSSAVTYGYPWEAG